MGMKIQSNHFISNKTSGGNSIRLGPKSINNLKCKKPIFDEKGHVTLNSISARREFFLGKSIARLEHELNKRGYKTTRRPSCHKGSKAKIIIILNSSKERNITQIQVSSGSKRHGNVPYVKISTNDIGRIKIIGTNQKQYKTDGHENAKLLYRRK